VIKIKGNDKYLDFDEYYAHHNLSSTQVGQKNEEEE